MKTLLLVFIGGGVGSLCRYGISRALAGTPGAFPWATLLANVLSCFLLGFLVEWSARGLLTTNQRLLLATGFCGGFSTFSTFAGETCDLYERGLPLMAFVNIASGLVVCMIGLMLGMKLGARI